MPPLVYSNFAFLVALFVVNLRIKFEVCSFSRTGNIDGVPKFNSRSRDLSYLHFLSPDFAFFDSTHCSQSAHQI